MRSVISLTPPSSPPADEKLELEKRSTDRVETVTENVENLVDEHFRNCGYDNVVRSKSSNQEMINNTDQNEFSSFIQKFLKSQVIYLKSNFILRNTNKVATLHNVSVDRNKFLVKSYLFTLDGRARLLSCRDEKLENQKHEH